MFFLYILKSLKDGTLYLGSTGNLIRRMKEHNSGASEWTKKHKPFKLVYVEGYAIKEEALRREHNLKLRAKSMRQLKLRIKQSLSS